MGLLGNPSIPKVYSPRRRLILSDFIRVQETVRMRARSQSENNEQRPGSCQYLGLGFRVESLGIRVLGFRVLGLGVEG